MSQAADLEHLFQLEQILSLRSILGEQCDNYSILEDSLMNDEVNCRETQNRLNSTKGEPHDSSITSFDPGGEVESLRQKDVENKDQDKEDSEIQQSNTSCALNDSTNCNPNVVNSVSNTEKEILSYDSSNCGRSIVFIALTGNGSNNVPQLGSIILKPGLQYSSRESDVSKNQVDSRNESMEYKMISADMQLSAYHVSWFDHGDSSADVLTCVTLSEKKKLCLVSCRDGSLYLLPIDIVFPGIQLGRCNSGDPDDNRTKANGGPQLSSGNTIKIPFELFAIPKPLHHRRANPTALIIWSTNDFAVGIVGTSQGKIIAVDLQNGYEVRSLKCDQDYIWSIIILFSFIIQPIYVLTSYQNIQCFIF